MSFLRWFFRNRLLGCLFWLVVAGGVLSTACGAVYWYSFRCTDLRCDSIDFNSAGWQTEARQGPPEYVRLRMADDLLDRALQGKTRAQIVEMIGPSDETQYFSDWHAVYWLGPERGPYGIDSEWLVLRFVEDRGSEARLVRD
jgi:hypothetical protein